MTKIEQESRLRREKDILDRIDNVKRLIEMEGTLLTVDGARRFASYSMTDRNGKRLGDISDTVLNQLRDEIQLQLLSITALCYGSNPDVGEPTPMLEWNMDIKDERHPADKFRDVFDECLRWNA